MAAERHWIIEKTSELNQPVYFKDLLISEWKPEDGKGFHSCFHRRRKAMDIMKINQDSV